MSVFSRLFGKGKKTKGRGKAAGSPGRQDPMLGASTGRAGWDDAGWSAVKEKIQSEVRSILSRSVLETIRNSQDRDRVADDLTLRQTINRLYADALHDVLVISPKPPFEPGDQIIRWARDGLENWGSSELDAAGEMGQEMRQNREAMAETVLAALERAAGDEILRKAAEGRIQAESNLTAKG